MMRTKSSRLAAALLVSLAVAIAWAGQNALAQLGYDESEAKNMWLSAISSGSVYFGSAAGRVFKAAPAATQRAIVENLIGWAKGYSASAGFKRAYAESREASRPQAPDPNAAAVDEKKQQDEIAQMKKMAASLPPEQRKAIEEAAKMMEAMQKDPQMRQMQAEGAKMARKAAQDEYQRDLAKWNEDHPENPNVLIAKRLRAFLDTSANIDFSAKLVPSGDRMTFADANLEKKSAEWKLCYRAGPAAVAAARAAAAAWLKEIAQ
jgi:hypothetical protein